MTKAGLNTGNICQITDEDGKLLGHGIAWRALDKMGSAPKTKPAKMTETLRDAYGIKEGSHVGISSTQATIVHAGRVVLVDCTTVDPAKTGEKSAEDNKWQNRCRTALGKDPTCRILRSF